MKKIILFFAIVTYCFTKSQTIGAFITTWKTNDGKITIPAFATNATHTYNYTANLINQTHPGVGNWSGNNLTNGINISGLANGDIYRLEITGNFSYFNASISSVIGEKLLSIEQWGNIAWKDFVGSFMNCKLMVYNATDSPDLSNVENLEGMFQNCWNFVGNNTMNNWDTSNILSMKNTFSNCNVFNAPIGNWNTSKVTTMEGMFFSAKAFNQPLANWDTKNVLNMKSIFNTANAFNQNLGSWWLNNNVNLQDMFFYTALDCNNYTSTLQGWAKIL